MQRRIVISLTSAILLLAPFFAQPRKAVAQMGYSGKDMGRIGQWLTFNQLELYRLEIPSYAAPYSVLLASGHHGWRIVVFLRDGGEVNEDWDSGSLPKVFQLASTDSLVLLPKVGKNFGVTFTGCSIKDCQENYGAILYLPWSHEFFFKEISEKGVTCSETLLDPHNYIALRTLDAALKRQESFIPQYVPPFCPGMGLVQPPR
ncbi:MAG TPA: hypothetical protein VFN53_11550 [Acidobacteriaceae bacterium]|nr:hypothetical protein [Acidobacteriaceae bacterium]